MANVIPLPRPDVATPTLNKYGGLIEQYKSALADHVTHQIELPPLNVLAAMRSEISSILKPAQHWEILQAIASLQASLKIPPTIDDPEKFAEAMAFELAEGRFPVDVLLDAVRYARRTLDWFPSIKEMLEICSEVNTRRREPLRLIASMEQDHEGRRRRAERIRQEAEREAKRPAEREAHRERLKMLVAEAIAKFGADAPLPGDFDLADSISSWRVQRAGRLVSWQAALSAGEPWAAKFCRLMALAERTRQAKEQGQIPWDACLAIAKLIASDEAAARAAIDKLQFLMGRREDGGPPPESFWNVLWRIHKACGCDVPPGMIPPTPSDLKVSAEARAELAKMAAVADKQFRDEWEAKHPGLYPAAPRFADAT
jgi:hypothetical protein